MQHDIANAPDPQSRTAWFCLGLLGPTGGGYTNQEDQ